MIKVNRKTGEVRMAGAGSEMILELQIAVERLCEAMNCQARSENDKNKTKAFILDSVAFALCDEDEKEEIIEKMSDDPFVLLWKEGR